MVAGGDAGRLSGTRGKNRILGSNEKSRYTSVIMARIVTNLLVSSSIFGLPVKLAQRKKNIFLIVSQRLIYPPYSN